VTLETLTSTPAVRSIASDRHRWAARAADGDTYGWSTLNRCAS
jgi:hypothetical protein